MKFNRFGFACLAVVAFSGRADAQLTTLPVFQVPTDLTWQGYDIRGGGAVTGLNDKGQFVGTFGEQNWVIWGVPHAYIYNFRPGDPSFGSGSYSRSGATATYEGMRLGFIEGIVRPNPNFRYLDPLPVNGSDFNAKFFEPTAINNSNIVVGKLNNDGTWGYPPKAAILDLNTLSFNVLDVPGAVWSYATDINSSGTVVGRFFDGSVQRGFQFKNGQYTTIEAPWNPGYISISGINDDGYVVGETGWWQGFLWKDGVFDRMDLVGFFPTDINNAKQIIGVTGGASMRQGYLFENGVGYTFGPFGTWANTINNLGQIGGESGGGGFIVTANQVKGLASAVPEPMTWAMLIVGFGLVGAVARRKNARALAV